MVDAHVHLEKGSYCIEWIQEFVQYALSRNVNEIYFLEHTHIFKECSGLYHEMSCYNEYQNNWYRKKQENARPLKEYTDFIDEMKKERFPIKLKFGLEVCYSPEHAREIENIKLRNTKNCCSQVHSLSIIKSILSRSADATVSIM